MKESTFQMKQVSSFIINGKKYIIIHLYIFKKMTLRERDETMQAFNILIKLLSRSNVSLSDVNFLKAQSVDLFKILVLVSLKLIPIPIPITPILIMLGNKFGIHILPSSHLKKYENKELG